jgi:hypothetical protein
VLWSFLSSTEKTGYLLREEPSANRIIPEFQDLKVGDIILDGPSGTAYFMVAALEPNKVLALYSNSHPRYLVPSFLRDNPKIGISGEFSWVFILNEVDAHKTRLIVRARANYGPHLFRILVRPIFWPVNFLLTRRMLCSIKQRVEKTEKTTDDQSNFYELVAPCI